MATTDADLPGWLTPDERAELDHLLSDGLAWLPLSGPQMQAYQSEADVVGYGGAAGGGKGLALDTPLPTPGGFVKMGDVRPGDQLFDDEGRICTVTAASDVSLRPCYRLTFDDGGSIVADDVHRWVTFDARELSALTRIDPSWRAARRAKRPSRAKPTTSPARLAALISGNAARAQALCKPAPTGTVRDTAELARTLLTKKGRRNHAIRVAGALQTPDATLPIPPYALGAWLGDGASRNSQITGIDPEIWERIEAEGFRVRHYAWDEKQHNILGITQKLRALGVLRNKHIPAEYMRASVDQRLALLQGLMDTDGHAAQDGGSAFDGTNYRLVAGVFDLVRSLGVKATLIRGTAKLNGRIIGDKWRVTFTTALPVFYLKRKAGRLRKTRRTQRFRYLVSCDPVPAVPTRCISVDSPSRQYLAGADMIPTHNTDLAIGLALTRHKASAIFRREGTQLSGVVERMTQILGGRDGYNGQERIWRLPNGRRVEFGSTPNPGDEAKYQGRAKDLLVLDEATNFLETQARFLMGWVRTAEAGRKCRVLMNFNPPTGAEGRWVTRFFAPWIDRAHPNPARPGELRWFATIDGRDRELPDGRDFALRGDERLYIFDPADFRPEDVIHPQSRTFIPSRISDNPYLLGTGYMAQLQSLPEPLRSQMLNGDFQAGVEDDAQQIVPTAWVEAAQARWAHRDAPGPMDGMGVDVARGGRDETIIARRHGTWFAPLIALSGAQSSDGPSVAGRAIAARRDGAPVHIDIIGWGASPYDFLRQNGVQAIGVNGSGKSVGLSVEGGLRFVNRRAELWWRMREALSPLAADPLFLPPDPALLADLCAPRWTLKANGIQVEAKEEVIRRLGRSPDRGDAACLALIATMKQGAANRGKPVYAAGHSERWR